MNVTTFFLAIDEIYDSIIKIESTKYSDNHKTTLIFSLIDLLSKSVYGNQFNHSEKFQRALDEFFHWEYLNYVSVIMLNYELQKNHDHNFLELKLFVEQQLKTFPDGEALFLHHDFDIDVIRKIWPKDKKLNNNKLENFTHKRLIYANRNSLVHEMRFKGLQFQLFEINVPHYYQLSKISLDDKGKKILTNDVWQLKYPVIFFVDMFNQIRKNMESYMIEHNHDPFEKLNFSDNWLDKD